MVNVLLYPCMFCVSLSMNLFCVLRVCELFA